MDFFESGILGKLLNADDEDTAVVSKDSCNCPQPVGEFPEETPIAMAYVPFQKWEKPYDKDTGLARATIFPSLDKPFIGKGGADCGEDK